MKEIDKITIRLEKLFNDLGMPELYACADTFFSYGEDDDDMPTVFYSILDEDMELEAVCDKLYSEFYFDYTGKYLPISNYTFDILHEIGHHKTVKNFSKKEINSYRKECTHILEKNISLEEQQRLYMYLPVEAEATKEACRLVQGNIRLLKQFEKDMKKLFENLQKTLDNEN